MARIFFQNTSLFRLKQARSAAMRASKQTLHVCNASLQQCGGSMCGCNGPLHVRINLMRRSTPQCMFATTRCSNATAQCEFTTACCKNAPGRSVAALSHCIETSLEKRLQRLIVNIHQGDAHGQFPLQQESRSMALRLQLQSAKQSKANAGHLAAVKPERNSQIDSPQEAAAELEQFFHCNDE